MIIMPDLSHGEQYFDSHDNVSADPNCDIASRVRREKEKAERS